MLVIKLTKFFPQENFIHHDFQMGGFAIVNGNPYAAVLGQQFTHQSKAGKHHFQPLSVLQIVIVFGEGGAGVKRRVNVDTLDGSGVVRDEGFESVEVVALNKQIFGGGGTICFADGGHGAKRRAGVGPNVVVAGVPVESGHGGGLYQKLFLRRIRFPWDRLQPISGMLHAFGEFCG